MTLNPVEIRPAQPTPAEMEDMLQSMRASRSSPIQNRTQADQIRAAMISLSVPADRKWIAGRVATLLSQYFASSVPTEMMAAIADDWNAELKGQPAWAIQAACRWWMGADNPDRRRKPMPGDIAARVKREAGLLRLTEQRLRNFTGKPDPEQQPAETPNEESKARMQKQIETAFPSLKRFGGEA